MSPLSHSRRLLGVGAALLAAVLSAASAPAASAGSFEQISRANGPQGTASFTRTSRPVWVSDTGKRAIYWDRSLAPFGFHFFVRDIVTNTTLPLDGRIVTVFGVDRAEKNVLVDRRDGTGVDSTINLVVVPLDGSRPRVLVRTQAGVPSAAISGDGKTVAYSLDDGSGSYKVALPLGTRTKIDDKSYEFGTRSFSDNGSVLGGTDTSVYPETGAYWKGGTKTLTPGRTVISPNGATAAASIFRSGEDYIVARRLADGVVREYPIPGPIDNLTWISPNGLSIISAAFSGDPTPPQTLDLVTGQWTPITGPYAESIRDTSLSGRDFFSSDRSIAFSRSGRFAAAIDRGGYGNTVNLLEMTGRDLPGTQEPSSPSAYISLAPPTYNCGDPTGTFGVAFYAQPSWLPKAQRADVMVSADGAVVFQQSFTSYNGGNQSIATFPSTAKAITIRVTVTDSEGRTQTNSETVPPAIGYPGYCES